MGDAEALLGGIDTHYPETSVRLWCVWTSRFAFCDVVMALLIL